MSGDNRGRLSFGESVNPVRMQQFKEGWYIHLDDTIAWLKKQCENLDGNDKEVAHTITLILIRLKNRTRNAK